MFVRDAYYFVILENSGDSYVDSSMEKERSSIVVKNSSPLAFVMYLLLMVHFEAALIPQTSTMSLYSCSSFFACSQLLYYFKWK